MTEKTWSKRVSATLTKLGWYIEDEQDDLVYGIDSDNSAEYTEIQVTQGDEGQTQATYYRFGAGDDEADMDTIVYSLSSEQLLDVCDIDDLDWDLADEEDTSC